MLMALVMKAAMKPQLPQNQNKMLERTQQTRIAPPPTSTLLNKRLERMEVSIHSRAKEMILALTQKNQVRIQTQR